jgi:hypothetical protein
MNLQKRPPAESYKSYEVQSDQGRTGKSSQGQDSPVFCPGAEQEPRGQIFQIFTFCLSFGAQLTCHYSPFGSSIQARLVGEKVWGNKWYFKAGKQSPAYGELGECPGYSIQGRDQEDSLLVRSFPVSRAEQNPEMSHLFPSLDR